ncbi:MAG: glycosyltransferase [Acidobacteriota bacterium]
MTRRWRVLVVHNGYQQRGGEDSVVESEMALLRAHGHEVRLYARHNDEIEGASRLSLAVQTVWSGRTVDEVNALLDAFQPEVVHVHNTFPLISPSVYWAARRRGIPVVQTLHNFRLMCPQAMFLREGRVCEDCLGHVPWRGVMHACYRESRLQTAVLASSVTWHRMVGTYSHAVSLYVALNAFCRDKFIEGGLPAEQVVIKPNFVEDAGLGEGPRSGGLFVGRLSDDKGVPTLLAALRLQPVRLQVIGAGEHAEATRAQLGADALGFLPVAEILARMKRAAYLVVPSLWYENFPRTLVEAFSVGLPVIASRLGALAELVEDGVTGLLFEPGDAQDLARKLQWADSHPAEMQAMGLAARSRYLSAYSPAQNIRALTDIYERACAEGTGA